MTPDGVVEVAATVVAGHGVASGRSGDARFPGGTIAMQRPHVATPARVEVRRHT